MQIFHLESLSTLIHFPSMWPTVVIYFLITANSIFIQRISDFPDFYSRTNVSVYKAMFPIEFGVVSWHILCSIVNKLNFSTKFYLFTKIKIKKKNTTCNIHSFQWKYSPIQIPSPQFQNSRRRGRIWYIFIFNTAPRNKEIKESLWENKASSRIERECCDIRETLLKLDT